MKPKFSSILFGALLLMFSLSAGADNSVSQILSTATTSALDNIFTNLQTWTIGALSGFIILQFTWTHSSLLFGETDLMAVWAKFVGALFWAGVCLYVFKEAPGWLKISANYIMNKAINATGATFDPSIPIDRGINVVTTLLKVLDSDQSILGALNPFPSIMMGLISLVILAVSALLAFKLFMLIVETKIVIALSPISFSLLGLQAFRDQGLAPARYIVSMAYKAMLIGAVMAAMTSFSDSIVASFTALPKMSDPSVWPSLFSAAIGYSLLGALALRVDSIAVMLASGSTQMSTGDAAAVASTTAAAAGLTGSMIGAAVGGAGKASQSVSELMKGGGGSVSNASSSGRGSGRDQQPIGEPPGRSSSSLMSQSDGGAAGESSSAAAVAAGKSADAARNGERADAGAQMAGATPEAAAAGGAAAQSGGSAAEISGAVQAAGGSPAQGVAAAMSAMGAGQHHIAAAVKALEAGAQPKDVGIAVRGNGHVTASGFAAAQAAEAAANVPVGVAHKSGAQNGATAGIGAEKEAKPSDKKQKRGMGDHLTNLSNELGRDSNPVHISMNTQSEI